MKSHMMSSRSVRIWVSAIEARGVACATLATRHVLLVSLHYEV